jgi:hypothetical protein
VILAAKEAVLAFFGAADETAVLTKTDLTSKTSNLRTLVALAALQTFPESSASSDSLPYPKFSESSLS